MSLNQALWKISDTIEPIKEVRLQSESELEQALQTNIEMLNENWLVIGRQVSTKYNSYVDLLALDPAGSLIIIELKRDKTPRDVVAQAIDYASWAKSLTPQNIADIYEAFDKKYLKSNKGLDKAYFDKFGTRLLEESLNNSHQIVVVAAELDSSTERIVSYLNQSMVPINVAFFKVFQINNEKYINRAWFMDPFETAAIAATQEAREPWNGEFYVSFGEGVGRSWQEAVKYGFISAGDGIWYSRTLNQLKPGDRIWVYVPQKGYVGVGKVTDTARKADEVLFGVNGKSANIYNLPHKATYFEQNISDLDKAEYMVKVDWLKTFELDKATFEVGFFGNQNTVCKPTAAKWQHTVERLKALWNIT